MLSLTEIQQYYPTSLHGFKNFMLREYLQYKILEIIFESEYSNKLCFLGGTCLRIVHNNSRFSEDLDFDNFDLTETDFKTIAKIIKKQLHRQGYDVEVDNVFAGAFHCYIKFPKLLFKEGLSGYINEKFLIQLDTEPQHFDYKPEKVIINKFDVFTSINTTPPEVLLAQKFYALCNRKRKKGRDFFDILFLLKMVRPNYDYLEKKMGITTEKALKKQVLQVCGKISLDEMTKDVAPFLFNFSDAKQLHLFSDYIKQVF